MFKYDCCGACEGRIRSVGEHLLYENEREMLGKTKGCDSEVFESCDRETNETAILGDKKDGQKRRGFGRYDR